MTPFLQLTQSEDGIATQKRVALAVVTAGKQMLLQNVHSRSGYPVAPCVPPEMEADPFQRLFCQLNLAFDGLLVMFRF